MIDRILRQHSYAMDRAELPVVSCPEPDHVTEHGRIRLPPPRKRVPGEALVKFGRQGRNLQKSAAPRSSAPFDLQPRKRNPPEASSPELQHSAPETPLARPVPLMECKPEMPALAPKKRPHIGQEIQIDGKRAILSWLGDRKFEVAIAGVTSRKRYLYSEYPDLALGKSKINRVKRESRNVAS